RPDPGVAGGDGQLDHPPGDRVEGVEPAPVQVHEPGLRVVAGQEHVVGQGPAVGRGSARGQVLGGGGHRVWGEGRGSGGGHRGPDTRPARPRHTGASPAPAVRPTAAQQIPGPTVRAGGRRGVSVPGPGRGSRLGRRPRHRHPFPESVMCLAPPVAAAAPPAGAARLLRSVARRYWPRLGLTYLLFAVENGLMLLQPLCLGRAIDGLVRGDRGGWWVLAAVYLAHAAVGAVRRVFDTRSFTAIYRDLAAAMVAAQRGRGVPVSRVATRSALSRSLVDFLEHDLPLAMHTFASLAGALVLLWWYDAALAAACTALVGPYWLLARWYRRRLAHHNRDLHDQ